MRAVPVLCALAGLMLLAPAATTAEEVSARARLDSTNYTIGDWITVHIELKHPPGVEFQPVLGDTTNGYYVVRRPTLNRTSGTVTEGELVVARYDSGRTILPGIPFAYSLPGDTLPRTVTTNPLLITVHSVDVDLGGDIKDVKPQMSVPLSAAEIALYAGIVIALGVIGYAAYRYLTKRKPIPPVEEYVRPRKPAHVVALEELALLKEKRLWQQGKIKEYYSEVTEILRRYVENRFGVMALEQTTDEILHALSGVSMEDGILAQMERMLRTADLVKFARYQPGVADHENMMTIAYDVVERTRASSSSAQKMEATHVGA